MATFITRRAKSLGLKMEDAKDPLMITVSFKDIEQAKQKNSKCCAFARAAKRIYHAKNAYFFRSTAWLEFDSKLVRYMLPPSMQKEIVSFDRSHVMAPGTYQMRAPGAYESLPTLRKRSKEHYKKHPRQVEANPGPAAPLPTGKAKMRRVSERLPDGTVRVRLEAPKGSTTMERVKERSAKRPGRHQPAYSGIQRKVVHRAQYVRTTHEPEDG